MAARGKKLQVTFKSGAQIVVWVKSWTYTKNNIGEQFTWTAYENDPTIIKINLDNVDAIVEV